MAEWIDLLDPDRGQLEQHLPREVHERAMDQLLAPVLHDDEPRPKLEGHDRYVLGVFLVPFCIQQKGADLVYFREIDLIVTHDVVLTVRKTPKEGDAFDPVAVREAVEAEGALPAGMIAYYVVDDVAESYLRLVDLMNDDVDELEDDVERVGAEEVRTRISHLR